MAVKLVDMARAVSSLFKLLQTLVAKLHEEKGNQQQRNEERFVMVAIVGAGHVPGICQYLTNATITNMKMDDILPQLLTTRRWANDEDVQQEVIPYWVNNTPWINDGIEPSVN